MKDPATALRTAHHDDDPARTRALAAAYGEILRRSTDHRAHLAEMPMRRPAWALADDDLLALLARAFTPSMLQVRRIRSQDPGPLLDWVIDHEAIHPIDGPGALRGRLDPDDRGCFGLFHPVLPDAPVAFTEVALTAGLPTRIGEILDPDRSVLPAHEASTAVLYSISNCYRGLRGLALGAHLLRRAVQSLVDDHPNLRSVVTLSPVPGLRTWVATVAAQAPVERSRGDESAPGELRLIAEALLQGQTVDDDAMRRLVTTFIVREADDTGAPVDPVARFHMGNGASLDHVLIDADRSDARMRQSFGVMVSYRYERRSS